MYPTMGLLTAAFQTAADASYRRFPPKGRLSFRDPCVYVTAKLDALELSHLTLQTKLS